METCRWSITTIFDATGSHLILEEPGSSITTTKHESASDLADPKERLPVVLNPHGLEEKTAVGPSGLPRSCRRISRAGQDRAFRLQNDDLVPLIGWSG